MNSCYHKFDEQIFLLRDTPILTKVHCSHDCVLNEANIIDNPPEPTKVSQDVMESLLPWFNQLLEPGRPMCCMEQKMLRVRDLERVEDKMAELTNITVHSVIASPCTIASISISVSNTYPIILTGKGAALINYEM